jgi:signal transduction histidine kinase
MSNQNDRFRKTLLLGPGVYRILAFAGVWAVVLFINKSTGAGASPFQKSNLVFFGASSGVYFFLLRFRKLLAALLFVEYYMVFSFAYVPPHIPYLELIWTPGIIVALALVLEGLGRLAVLAFTGLFGPVFLSYGCNNGVQTEFGGLSLPWAAALLMVLAPVTVLAFFLDRICIWGEHTEKRYRSLKADYARLTEINNAVSQRIFTLTNDTAQKERYRISKEIHDTAGYVFINLMMMLQAASNVINKDIKKAEKLINDAWEYAKKGINEIRRLLRDIRSYTVPVISIQNELFSVGESFQNATDVKIEINYGQWPGTFSKTVDSFFISFMQESFTNALKHGHAAYISVNCWEMDGYYGMSVFDNGSGASYPIIKGIGITAMEDVAYELGGRVIIKTNVDGFRITAMIPCSVTLSGL